MTHYHNTETARQTLASACLGVYIEGPEDFEKIAQNMARYSLDPATAVVRFYGMPLDDIGRRVMMEMEK